MNAACAQVALPKNRALEDQTLFRNTPNPALGPGPCFTFTPKDPPARKPSDVTDRDKRVTEAPTPLSKAVSRGRRPWRPRQGPRGESRASGVSPGKRAVDASAPSSVFRRTRSKEVRPAARPSEHRDTISKR